MVANYDKRYCTIHHLKYFWKPPGSSTGSRCQYSKQYRNVLRSGLHRLLKQDQQRTKSCDPSSHTNYRYSSTPEKMERMKNLHEVVHCKEQQIQSLCKKINHAIQEECVVLDGAMHSDLVSIMKRHSPSNADDVSDSKFKDIFGSNN